MAESAHSANSKVRDDKDEPRIDDRPVHLQPLSNDVQACTPKARVY